MTFWLGQARFERCSFDHTKMRMWFSHDAEFVNCRFAGPISSCRFFGRPVHAANPPRRVNEFRGNDFRDAELIWTSFEGGIDLTAQKWPETGEYLWLDRVPERAEIARRKIEKWPESTDKAWALRVLNGVLEDEQDAILRRREEVLTDDAAGRVWQILIDSL